VKDIFGGWIRRGSPLINILYDSQHKCANKKYDLQEDDFHEYNIKYSDWRIRSNADVFQPSEETIQAILEVMIEYNNPKFPVSTVIPKQRDPPSTLLMISPPRHRHGGPRNLVVRRPDFDNCTNESVYYNNMYCTNVLCILNYNTYIVKVQIQSANDGQWETDICTNTNQRGNGNDGDLDTCSQAVSDEVVNQCHSNNKKRKQPEDMHDSECLINTRRRVLYNTGATCKDEEVKRGVAEDNPSTCTNEPEALECEQHEWVINCCVLCS